MLLGLMTAGGAPDEPEPLLLGFCAGLMAGLGAGAGAGSRTGAGFGAGAGSRTGAGFGAARAPPDDVLGFEAAGAAVGEPRISRGGR